MTVLSQMPLVEELGRIIKVWNDGYMEIMIHRVQTKIYTLLEKECLVTATDPIKHTIQARSRKSQTKRKINKNKK
jgi:hypothetical protein